MTHPCPDAWTLHRYRDGLLVPSDAEAFEGHAFACVRCRAALAVLGGADPGAAPALPDAVLHALPRPRRIPPLRRWGWAAAAAGLLLAAGWALRGGGTPAGTGMPGAPAAQAPEGFPAGVLGDPGAPSLALLRGASVLASPGARILASGRSLTVASGSAWLEQVGGEPLALELPGGRLLLHQGVLAVEASDRPTAQASWLRTAWAAAEAIPRVTLLDGTARIEGLALKPGQRLSCREGRWTAEGVSPEAVARHWEVRRDALASLPGEDLVPQGARLGAGTPALRSLRAPPGGPYRWLVRLEGRGAPTEMRLRFPAGGRWREWTAGLAGRPSPGPEQLEIGWDGAWLWARDGGRLRFACPASGLERELPATERSGWELSVWGGEARVVLARMAEGR